MDMWHPEVPKPIQAIWIYRNLFKKQFNASYDEICILCSEDSHYSMPKAGNILNLSLLYVPVTDETREITDYSVAETVKKAQSQGKKYFIVVTNMMTTMFGSVDCVDTYTKAMSAANLEFRVHVDGAYGGFVYPFSTDNDQMTFHNPYISSVTLDAHKMVQAPFGTGMILQTYGPHDWFEKIHILNYRTNWLCNQLREMNIEFYRHPSSNIVAIRAKHIKHELAHKYGLVPDTHNNNPNWYKIVLMEHVHVDHLLPFVEELEKEV
jgi:tyrosine decarboxylase/aspartate 1-decarboxylase